MVRGAQGAVLRKCRGISRQVPGEGGNGRVGLDQRTSFKKMGTGQTMPPENGQSVLESAFPTVIKGDKRRASKPSVIPGQQVMHTGDTEFGADPSNLSFEAAGLNVLIVIDRKCAGSIG